MKGFTLVELVIAIAVAGVVISGVVVTSAELVKNSADPMLAVQRVHVAQSFLDEIEAQAFSIANSDCDPASIPSNREDYTHICHYNAITNASVEDVSGNAVAGLTGFQVSVSVPRNLVGTSTLGPTGDKVSANQVLLVTVTVTSQDGGSTVLSSYFVEGT